MEQVSVVVTADDNGLRVDRFLANKIAELSRSEIQRVIENSGASVNEVTINRKSYMVKTGETVKLEIHNEPKLVPQSIDLQILHEDEAIVVVNKPSGLVVHPGAGDHRATLIEGLLARYDLPDAGNSLRPGIVHRLDKETTGVIVVARTAAVLTSLQEQFAERTVSKTYLVQVEGEIDEDEGLIDAPVGRDSNNPTRMTVCRKGKTAKTQFHVLRSSRSGCLMIATPQTGRTHQIRVHFRYIGHPVIGDKTYGTGNDHLMLHAWKLEFTHPVRKERVSYSAPVPRYFPLYPYDEIAQCAEPSRSNRHRQKK